MAWFASDDWLAKNGDTARRFADAMRKGHDWANTQAKESIDIFALLDIAASSGMLPRAMTTAELVWQPDAR